jgi:ribosomal-protein-alanine N-acetyltransferase
MSATDVLFETPRLKVRPLTEGDLDFLVELLNTPGFLRHIGDREVRTRGDALRYLQVGPQASYARHGHGLYAVDLKDTMQPIGMCGLLKRDALDAPDIGYAFLPQHEGRGYAHEAAAATLRHAREVLGLPRVLAVVSPGNARSIRLLEKLGLRLAGQLKLPGYGGDSLLYGPL